MGTVLGSPDRQRLLGTVARIILRNMSIHLLRVC